MSYGVRKKFYQSDTWKMVKNNVWLKQSLLCARCNKPVYVDGISKWLPKEKRRRGIVHHKIHLDDNNVFDLNIALDSSNLEGLCKECHELEHHQDTVTRKDLMFDENGNLIKRD